MMQKVSIVLADAARARFFTLEEQRGQAGRTEPVMRERVGLIHSGRRQRDAEKLSETRPGTQGALSSRHAVDDHRGARTAEADRRFASEVMAEAGIFCGQFEIETLLVVAPPRFLGHLREGEVRASTCVNFVGLEISEMTAPKALDHLTRHGYLELDAAKQEDSR